MIIQCTKKLLDELKLKSPAAPQEEESQFAWHANVMTFARRKTVVFVHDSTRYCIVLHGLKAKDFTRLDQLLEEGIRQAFQQEFIKEDVIEQYVRGTTESVFTKTKNRTSVSRMSKACEVVLHFEERIQKDATFQTELSMKVSRMLVGDGKNDWIYPNKELYRVLEEMHGGPIFQPEALQLKVTLQLQHHEVWRRLVVPMNITFDRLHKALQIAFDWKSQHLHEFRAYPIARAGNVVPMFPNTEDSPFLTVVCTQEAVRENGGPLSKHEKGLKVAEYLPARIEYTYDFGDGWEHEIVVERTIDNNEVNYPICLEGIGQTPPEDVGGDGGYEAFLQIIADKNHPDYQHMKSWSSMQGYREFDLKLTNNRLRGV